MKINRHTSLLTIAAALSLATHSQAALLATYLSGDNNLNASFVADNLTASTIANQIDNNNPVRTDFGAVTWGGDFRYAANGDTDATAAFTGTAPPTTDYLGFTLTADAGFTIGLDTMTFDWGLGSNFGNMTTDFGYQIFASVDGGTWSLVGGDVIASATYEFGEFTALPTANVDMSGLATTADGGDVEVRLYSYSGGNTASHVLVFNQIEFNAIPEPSTTLLGGLGLLALLRRRR